MERLLKINIFRRDSLAARFVQYYNFLLVIGLVIFRRMRSMNRPIKIKEDEYYCHYSFISRFFFICSTNPTCWLENWDSCWDWTVIINSTYYFKWI